MSSLINPTKPNPQSEQDFEREPVYLRNPSTGVIFKLTHRDSIQRCLHEFYMPSSEEAMRAQAIELAELQGRPLPSWATPEQPEAKPEAPVASVATTEPDPEPERTPASVMRRSK